MISHAITVRMHGHYLVDGPSRSPAVGVLVGCHGYMESAAIQMERLQAIPGGEAWVHVSVQGLHRPIPPPPPPHLPRGDGRGWAGRGGWAAPARILPVDRAAGR